MERIRGLNRYQRIVLILLAAMLVVFTALYVVVSAREGYEYGGRILVPAEKDGATVYTGTVRGKDAFIKVTADKVVTVWYGEKQYGPYTAREDPTAIPDDNTLAPYMTGIEILDGDRVFFRGGVMNSGGGRMYFDEEGSPNMVTITYSNGNVMTSDGKIFDEMKPTTAMIVDLMEGPELTHKGVWILWAMGVFASAVTAISILFADDLFRFRISFRVSNPQDVEPSSLEIAGRYLEWTILPVAALIVYIIGLL